MEQVEKHWEKTIEWVFAVKVSQATNATFAPLAAATETNLADAFGRFGEKFGIVEFKKDLDAGGIRREIAKFKNQSPKGLMEAKATLCSVVETLELDSPSISFSTLLEAKLPHLIISGDGSGADLELVQSDFFNVLIAKTQGVSNKKSPLYAGFDWERIQDAFVSWEKFYKYLVALFVLKNTTTVSGISGAVGITSEGRVSVLPLSSLSKALALNNISKPTPPNESSGFTI
ncbi:hypothetical protein [Roseibium sp. SCP14]|uniref:hypothetical protein n=1 Tax=Roseibium sp. SCP14 TaxID=3141375 RepID=UPI0033351DCA